jgi:16S rRNA (uracil1498-N3)-methyltransferase
MNLVLIFKEDFISSTRVRLQGRRGDHITTVLRSKVNDRLTVGLCNGQIGEGKVLSIDEDVLLDVELNQPPPAPLPLTLVLALPRPHMFKRTLTFAAALGIKKIMVLNFSRVDKSLWNSSSLRPQAITEQLVLGLEQAKDTLMPDVSMHEDFKDFVTKQLPDLARCCTNLVAHPGVNRPCPRDPAGQVNLVIGPEGGILDWELESLRALDFVPVDLGARILRVDAVVPYIVGKLYS